MFVIFVIPAWHWPFPSPLQVDHIHMVKTGELQSAAVWRSAALEDSLPSIVPKAG